MASSDAYQPLPEPNLDELITLWRKQVNNYPQEASGWYNLGSALSKRGGKDDLEQAVEALNKASVISGDDPAVWFNLGNAYLRRRRPGDIECAVEAYTRCLELEGEQAKIWVGLACALLLRRSEGDIDAGVMNLRRAIDLEPERPAYRLQLAMALEALGSGEALAEAAAQCQMALKKDVDNARGWYLLARIQAQLGDRDKSMVALEQSILLDSDFSFLAGQEKAFQKMRNNKRFQQLIGKWLE
jgi:cytochrome c-type biogenesis protein CcmH/NrfG